MDDLEDRIDAAFAAVKREDFLPKKLRRHAGEDRPLGIGHGQTNSQPTTVRNMLRLLDVRQGQQVLDVGSGSGWTCALLAHLVGAVGRVTGVELVPDLVQAAQRNLRALDHPGVTVQMSQPGVLGVPALAPFDRILVSAEARSVPEPLVEQLGRGGRMVVPASGRLAVVQRDDTGQVDVRRVGCYAFVPLIWHP
ncbi:MAG: methyltransferase domain-containing protein [Propionibacteriales bacterium]|nr:methyltransferase domain-containing protein [Propionibacteriales bacterium]